MQTIYSEPWRSGEKDRNMLKQRTTWEQLSPQFRKRLVWWLWFVTWVALLCGLINRGYYDFVVLFSTLHAILFLILFRFQLRPFPIQVRIVYLLWVIVGSYIPYMLFLMHITTIGLAGNLFFKYCPLARLLHLCPWNRNEPLSLNFIGRVFLTPPTNGKFAPQQPAKN